MGDEFLERLFDQPKRQRVSLAGGAQLQQQTLPEIARPHARRIEILDDLQHGEHLRIGEARHFGVDIALFRFPHARNAWRGDRSSSDNCSVR